MREDTELIVAGEMRGWMREGCGSMGRHLKCLTNHAPASPSHSCYVELPHRKKEPNAVVVTHCSHMSASRVSKSYSTSPETARAIEDLAASRGESVSSVINEAIGNMLRSKVERDSWGTVDPSDAYDPFRFYTGSEDKRGHSAMMRFNVPKNIMGQIKAVIDDGSIPEYRSLSDFGRDAVVHRARQVAQWLDNEQLTSAIDLYLMIENHEKLIQSRKDTEHLLDLARTNFENAMSKHKWDWIEAELSDMGDRTDMIPEQSRDEYVDFLTDWKERLEMRRPARNLKRA